eukprot:COSAG06_NODE_65_length_26676_cov_11.671107_10_plen_67_part_00
MPQRRIQKISLASGANITSGAGTMVRRLDLAKAKASLKDKFAPNWSEEVFLVVKVTKQKSKGLRSS